MSRKDDDIGLHVVQFTHLSRVENGSIGKLQARSGVGPFRVGGCYLRNRVFC
jgi:hypothetical protein